MSGTNTILEFCPTDTGSNLESDAAYLANAQRVSGNAPGIADLTLVNKALRQATLLAASLGQLIADHQSANVVDTLTPAALEALMITAIQTLGSAVGQCRIGLSGSNLKLMPYQGNQLTITGVPQVIPSTGVTLAPTGTTASTAYYIYAAMSSGVMVLEFSATGHVTDATTGVEVKSGDPTRTLVAQWYVDGTGAWSNLGGLGLNWFNRRPTGRVSFFSTNRSTTSGTYVEINTEIRITFLLWAGDVASYRVTGVCSNTNANSTSDTSVAYDGTTAEDSFVRVQPYLANAVTPVVVGVDRSGLSEGLHYATVLGDCNSGTATWLGSGTAGTRTAASLLVPG